MFKLSNIQVNSKELAEFIGVPVPTLYRWQKEAPARIFNYKLALLIDCSLADHEEEFIKGDEFWPSYFGLPNYGSQQIALSLGEKKPNWIYNQWKKNPLSVVRLIRGAMIKAACMNHDLLLPLFDEESPCDRSMVTMLLGKDRRKEEAWEAEVQVNMFKFYQVVQVGRKNY
ncbi:TPA: hypothetical protein I7730_00375 [Vibrio vulnificus]|uniref:Uncharacterized protein n=1 Tax=Vibrio vulnificus TaxID=672 RepID=A0A8H9K6Z5_VIBVL|nr:hypothetical protein [Vibrio vulnificus]